MERGASRGGWRFGLVVVCLLIFFALQEARISRPTARPAQRSQIELKPEIWPPESDREIELAADPTMKNYYVIFDGSGSMAEHGCSGGRAKVLVAKEALKRFAALVPKGAQLGLLAFDINGVRERAPLAAGDRTAFNKALDKVQAGAGTPLRSAISAGYQKLEEQAQRQLGYGEYHLVVVTDGLANAGEEPDAVVDRILKTTPIVFHTIGFCISSDHTLNRPGRTYYASAMSPKELSSGLGDVLAEAPRYDRSGFEQVR